MTEEQIIEIIKLEAHKNLTIVDEGTDSYNDYVIRGVDLMAKSLVKLFSMPDVSNHVVCDDWIHQERIKNNDDNYCPICGKQLQSK